MSTENQDTLDAEVTVTATDGVQIPMRLLVEFPKDYGFYAVKMLEHLAQNTDQFYSQLIHRHDASTIKVLMESGDSE